MQAFTLHRFVDLVVAGDELPSRRFCGLSPPAQRVAVGSRHASHRAVVVAVGSPVSGADPSATVVSLVQRPDLAQRIPAFLASRWPRFMLEGRPGHDVDLTVLAAGRAPQHQVVLLDADDEILGVGVSLPLGGAASALPSGWDGAVTAAAQFLDPDGSDAGARPGTVCALSITMSAAGLGRGLSELMLQAMKQAAAAAGAPTLIVPVRPTLKARYPLIAMQDYADWRTTDGQVFDPWLRLHLRVGGMHAGIAAASMTITGSIAQWEQWTDLALPGSGEHVVRGGLTPLRVDRDRDVGMYQEPNVWIVHRTGQLGPGRRITQPAAR